MWAVLAAATMAMAMATPSPTPGPVAPPESDRVGIDVLNINGSGCRQGTVTAAVSPDNEAFTVLYSNYQAQVGPGVKKKDGHRDCRLNLKVRPPSGYAFTIVKADYRGYAELAAGATAALSASFYFQGPKPNPRLHPLAGPMADTWQVTDVADSSLVFGPCGTARNLSVDTTVTVDAGRSNPNTTPSYLAMDSADVSVQSTYHLGWKRCA